MSELLVNLIALRERLERDLRLTEIDGRRNIEFWQFKMERKSPLKEYLDRLDNIIAIGILSEQQEENPTVPHVLRYKAQQEKRRQEVRFAWSS